MSKSSGFTLLELCLAIAIAVIILCVALPSLGLVFSEQRLRRSFDKFDALAARAQALSMSQRKPCFLVWDKTGVTLRSEDASEPTAPASASHLDLGPNEKIDLQLPSALIANPPKRWVFWPTGTCEPANILYRGDAGHWIARYDPLTVRGALSFE